MILYAERLYRWFERPLGVFERRRLNDKEHEQFDGQCDALVLGVGRYGARLAERLSESGWRVIGVYIDPVHQGERTPHAFQIVYGDVCNSDFLAHLPLASARWVVSTLRDHDADLAVIAALRGAGYRGKIAVTAHGTAEQERLREIGAAEIFEPLHDAADHASRWLMETHPAGAAPA